jgi:hypothetical protein
MTFQRSAAVAFACCALFAAGCATSSKYGANIPSTDVSVVDEKGDSIAGEVSLFGKGVDEKCLQDGYSCPIDAPAGTFALSFRKMRAGRLANLGSANPTGSGSANSDKGVGCLRARVQVTPGQKIVCKKKAEFNCARGVWDTMDCGDANASKFGYKPAKGDGLDDPPAPGGS